MGEEESWQTLLAKARKQIRRGDLPGAPDEPTPYSVWGGYGTGASCSLCQQAIGREDVEYEIDYGHLHTLRFHVQCHVAWREACAAERDKG